MHRGYYVGNSYDIFTEEELINLETEITNLLPGSEENNQKWNRCISANFDDNELQKYDSFIPFHEIENRKKFINDNNGIVTQQWYFTDLMSLRIKNLDYSLYKDRIRKFIAGIYNTNFMSLNINPINVTYYDKEDFIAPHKDGQNARRLCAFLLYFGDSRSYSKENGGRIFISQKEVPNYMDYSIYTDNYMSVEPIRPNYVILDFTKHNVVHAVEKCLTTFNRYSLLCFPTKELVPSNL